MKRDVKTRNLNGRKRRATATYDSYLRYDHLESDNIYIETAGASYTSNDKYGYFERKVTIQQWTLTERSKIPPSPFFTSCGEPSRSDNWAALKSVIEGEVHWEFYNILGTILLCSYTSVTSSYTHSYNHAKMDVLATKHFCQHIAHWCKWLWNQIASHIYVGCKFILFLHEQCFGHYRLKGPLKLPLWNAADKIFYPTRPLSLTLTWNKTKGMCFCPSYLYLCQIE